MNNCLLSIDLNTTRLNNQNYTHLLNSLPNSNLTIHIYNYIEQKHNKLPFNHNEILHQYLGSRKKIALDIPQALDIVEICAKQNFDKVYILCGEYESEFLYNKLSNMKITFCKILPSTLRQTDENSIIKVEMNNNELQNSKFETSDLILHSNLEYNSTENKNDFKQNNLHDVDKIKTEVATSSICEVQQFKPLSINPSSNTEKKHLQLDNPKETIDLKVLKENFQHIIKLKDKNDNKSNQSTITSKLTPEQIKQIYAYIKYRKLIRQI